MVHWSLVKFAIDVILFLLIAELKWTAIKEADTSVLLQIKNNTLLFWVNTIAARICRLVSNRWKNNITWQPFSMTKNVLNCIKIIIFEQWKTQQAINWDQWFHQQLKKLQKSTEISWKKSCRHRDSNRRPSNFHFSLFEKSEPLVSFASLQTINFCFRRLK